MNDIYAYDAKATEKARKDYYSKGKRWMLFHTVSDTNFYLTPDTFYTPIENQRIISMGREEYEELDMEWGLEVWAIYMVRE